MDNWWTCSFFLGHLCKMDEIFLLNCHTVFSSRDRPDRISTWYMAHRLTWSNRHFQDTSNWGYGSLIWKFEDSLGQDGFPNSNLIIPRKFFTLANSKCEWSMTYIGVEQILPSVRFFWGWSLPWCWGWKIQTLVLTVLLQVWGSE